MNPLIKKLLPKGEVTSDSLKKLYRELSKKLHPDLSLKSGTEFISLQKYYETALEEIESGKWIIGKKFLSDVRKNVYSLLKLYSIKGLYSSKIRLKENLKERNQKIIDDLVELGGLYDEHLPLIIIDLNTLYAEAYLPFNQKAYRKGRESMISGLANFLDYQKSGSLSYKRCSISFLDESISYMIQAGETKRSISFLNFLNWLLIDIEKDPLKVYFE